MLVGLRILTGRPFRKALPVMMRMVVVVLRAILLLVMVVVLRVLLDNIDVMLRGVLLHAVVVLAAVLHASGPVAAHHVEDVGNVEVFAQHAHRVLQKKRQKALQKQSKATKCCAGQKQEHIAGTCTVI